MKREEVASNICTMSISTNSKTFKESEIGKVTQQHNTKNMLENKNTSHCDDGCVPNWTRNKENINNNNNLNIHKISLDQNRYGNLNTRGNVSDARSYENASNLNVTGKFGNAQGHKDDSRSNHTLQHCSHSALSTFERKVSSEKVGTPESRSRCSCVKANVLSDKALQEDMQVTGEERQKSCESKAKSRHREVCYNSRRKTANPINLSRKAKSFFRRRSRLATTDSDCTLMLPGPRRIKSKQYRYERTRDRLKISQLSRRRNWMNCMNPIRKKSYTSKRSRVNRSRLLTNLRADNPFEQPLFIPLETQELLNKSYWEYYRKLRKIALTVPDTVREEDKRSSESRSRVNLPVSRTLQQCSVLSCMINNTLDTSEKVFQNPATAVERSLSDPTANGSKTRENVCEAFGLSSTRVKRIKRKRTNHASKRLFGLKAIVFLVVMVYVAIIFLPMMYDYLMLDEEHDDYEDVNYVALTLEYIASSFEEAFDEIVDVVNTIFLRSVRFNREL
ncbi:uncharacterized protein LOC116849772 isoform X1 [Odontomachus brunneus]|uniref:uncharacterized protein LOC116849772 isoform X1 n=1 Tax=Odontomachus brunneus TaxID=486640 RepID=UPI0013F27EBD|nr:uncharacterized protein LOC116849772 isoform X1 [Odontomachus brunneus]